MKINTHTLKSLKTTLVSLFLGTCIALPVVADDIEIYTSLGPAALASNPNIMFLIDSSGSMGDPSWVKEYYDSGTTYAGACLTASIYFSASGKFPDCTTSTDYFDAAANTCDHSVVGYNADGTKITPGQDGSLLMIGTYSDQVAQYDPVSKAWRGLSTVSAAERAYKVECKSDSGIHGETSGGNQKYIKDTVGWTNTVPSDTDNPHPVWYNSANNLQLFSGNYMNYLADPGIPSGGAVPLVEISYMDQVKHAVEIMVRGNTRVDIGLMRFDSKNSEGGAVLYPILDVGADRNDFFSRLENKVSDGGYTPLSEAYYEALLYFGGKEVDYGKTATPSNQVGSTQNGDPKFYETPITSECDLNYIVFLSDGRPTKDVLNATRQGNLPGFNASYSCNTLDDGDIWNDIDNNCLPKLATWAFTHDVATRGDKAAHEGFQNIITHTIGFGNIPVDAQALLQATADSSDQGDYYLAQSEAELIAAFNDIIAGVLAQNSTFSSPAVSVNAFNRATNLDDLYFTLFKPKSGEHWEGNIKKFKLLFNATTGDPFIADQNNNPAIGADGFFLGTSLSYWTVGAADGPETAVGGAASLIATPGTGRKIYTMAAAYTDADGDGVLIPGDTDLTSGGNALLVSNAAITEAMLGITGYPDLFTTSTAVPYRTALLNWAGGVDVWANGKSGPAGAGARAEMGDPLHAEPALVQYGMTAGKPDLVAYVATNDGYLHAINTLTGLEYFSFIPQEMLLKLDDIFVDSGANGKQYGLDGNVVAWINDVNGDGTISGAGEHVYLYLGMRRGGRYIYSMDVTDRTKPKLRWVIKGGVGDFAELGQTWSTVNVEKMNMGGTEKTVLIFGGGYDTGQDTKSTRGIDVVGRSIYIIDAETGELYWRAGPTGSLPTPNLVLDDMKYSMPARIKPLDVNSDGYIDRLYAADMGGQIWRIDIDNDSNGAKTVAATGGRIANLAADADINQTRRFYYPPDAAVIVQEGQAPFISVVAGSGYRAHPLNVDVHDRMYMIRDYDVYKAKDFSSYSVITEADLFDTTNNIVGEGTTEAVKVAAKASLNAAKGWYISFNQPDGSYVGEKALAEPLILNGVIIMTTYFPASSGATADACKPNVGAGAIYYVNITDGTPTYDKAGADGKVREDRKTFLERGGIPPSPTVIITEKGIATECVGTECKKARGIQGVQKLYWYEVEQ